MIFSLFLCQPGSVQTAFGDIDDFTRQGGLKAMGEALNRGMVLVMSLWDDAESLAACSALVLKNNNCS